MCQSAAKRLGRIQALRRGLADREVELVADLQVHPKPGSGVEHLADVAGQILSGNCLAGGATIRLEEKHFIAGLVTRLWNCASRFFKLLAGSFIFCETAAFRKIGGFSHELFAAEELELSKRLKKLARETGKRIVILHRHPLVTSARKMRLYTMREHLRFLARVFFSRGRALNKREAAHLWYDGRR